MLSTVHSMGTKNAILMSDKEFTGQVPLKANNPYELRLDHAVGIPDSVIQSALATGEMGFLHSFTTGSTVDGPGIRVVAWTSGCQYRCLYCHNPDTWKMTNGIPVTITRATEELSKYSAGLKIMSGGFTLSGGEPLMQDRFAVNLFTAAKKMGIHTALDTNGSLGKRLSDDDLKMIDLVLLDIKSWDPARHRKLTGSDNRLVLDFATRLAKLKKPVWMRFVLVPGLTDDREDIAMIAKFASQMGNVKRVDVLPFHQLGQFKWKELNIKYKLEGLEPPSTETVKQVCNIFRAEGLTAY
jgi:pyruvate formate lyase activating enzyme